jgi:cytochrome c oxidase cbb3-type subunit IV
MDINLLRTLLLLVCFCVFVGIALWALGKGQRSRFAEAARLPLDEDCAVEAQEGTKR